MSHVLDDQNAVDQDLIELFDSLFADRDRSDSTFDTDLWSDLQAAGLTRLTGTGSDGSEASWLEAAELIRSAAFHAVSLPIAESDVIAGWLAERVGLQDSDDRIRTSAEVGADGLARDVPWARHADTALLLSGQGPSWNLQQVEIAVAHVEHGSNIAGEPRDLVPAHSGESQVIDESIVREWRLRGALARSVQISGALHRAVALAVQYSLERVQFGRPIAAFQAVQHVVANIASEASIVLAATDSAVLTAAQAADWSDPQVEFDIAVAKSIASAAVPEVTRGAHQILGAIGTTAEHPLHTVTLPAQAWAVEFGTVHHWNRCLVDLTGGPSRSATPWGLISRTA